MDRRDFLKGAVAAAAGLAAARGQAASAKTAAVAVDLGFLSAGLTLVRRNEWTEMLPRTWLLRESSGYDRITIHHSGGEGASPVHRTDVLLKLEGILVGHMESRYGDIGYHFLVDHEGRVWEGRSLAYEGAHVASQNEGNVGVALVGNFETYQPSQAQVSAMGRLVELLRGHFQIKAHRVYGHRDIGQSVCPGRNLYGHVRGLKGQVSEAGA